MVTSTVDEYRFYEQKPHKIYFVSLLPPTMAEIYDPTSESKASCNPLLHIHLQVFLRLLVYLHCSVNLFQTRMHSSRMRTDRCSGRHWMSQHQGVFGFTPTPKDHAPLEPPKGLDPPMTTPPKEHTPKTTQPLRTTHSPMDPTPRKNMEPGSQTESDILHFPPNRMTHRHF